MTKSKEERYTEFAEFVFLVSGAIFLFFAGYVGDESVLMSFILMVVGLLCLCIRIEYTKEESA